MLTEVNYVDGGGGGVTMVKNDSATIDASGKVTIPNVSGKVVGAILRYSVSGYDAVVAFSTETSWYTLSVSSNWVEDSAHKITQSGTTATILTSTTNTTAKLVYYVQG